MNNNIGIIIPTLDMNQLAYESIYAINRELTGGSKDDYRIFFEELQPRCLDPLCATMNVTEMFSYTGILISTTLGNTQLALRTLGSIKKYFYVWDLEFLRQNKNYLNNVAIYRNNDIKLIARSQEHAIAIKNYCGRTPDLIMQSLSFQHIKQHSENKDGIVA